ncbi:MAG: hypothetical protein EXR98_18750 [Gemmataceae bacterium]|nr:hypothetical protein [Gemmataceae bacterium]
MKFTQTRRANLAISLLLGLTTAAVPATAGDKATIVRSAQSGLWSAPASWEGGKVPNAGARVQIRPGHRIVYDLNSDQAIRGIHVAGTLSFATDKGPSVN